MVAARRGRRAGAGLVADDAVDAEVSRRCISADHRPSDVHRDAARCAVARIARPQWDAQAQPAPVRRGRRQAQVRRSRPAAAHAAWAGRDARRARAATGRARRASRGRDAGAIRALLRSMARTGRRRPRLLGVDVESHLGVVSSSSSGRTGSCAPPCGAPHLVPHDRDRPGRPRRGRAWRRGPRDDAVFVARTSVSMWYPSSAACPNEAHVFSGCSAAPPRCANGMGPGWSRKGSVGAIARAR
jgi:hypothetical protein